jgi:hypothetical protein
MASVTLTLLVASIGIAAMLRCRADPRIDARYIVLSLAWIGLYAVFLATGFAVLFLLAGGKGPDAAGPFTLALLGWLALAVLALARWSPRLGDHGLRRPPLAFRVAALASAAIVCLSAGWLVSLPVDPTHATP